MKKRFQIKRMFCFLYLAVVMVISGCQNTKSKDTFVVATYTYHTNNRISNLKPLSFALEKILDRPVQLKSYPDVPSFMQGIQNEEVDLAFINTLGYLLLSQDSMEMTPIAALKVRPNAIDNYKTVLLSRNKGINSLEALEKNSENLSISLVAEGSTSGNLVPRLLLSSLGIKSPEKRFKKFEYGGNHTSTLSNLLEGNTDVCAVGSNEYHEWIKRDSTQLDSISVLWVSKEIPLGPALLHNRLDDSDRKKVTDFLLELHISNPDAVESFKQGWSEASQTERFHPITDEYYDNFREVEGKSANLSSVLNFFSITFD